MKPLNAGLRPEPICCWKCAWTWFPRTVKLPVKCVRCQAPIRVSGNTPKRRKK